MSARRALAVALATTGLLFLAAWGATPLPDHVRVGALDVLWLSASFTAGLACLWALRRPENVHVRASFACFAAAAFAWTAGQGIWTWREVVQEVEVPFLSPADLGFSLSVLLQAIGLLLWPRDRRPWELGRVLDFILIAGFATLFGLELLVEPILAFEAGGMDLLSAVVYPPSHILLFGVALAVFTLSGWRDRARLEVIAFTLLLLCVADSGYTYLGDEYSTGGVLDPLWMIGFAGVGLAALTPADWRGGRGWISERVQAVAPSLALVGIALVGILVAVSGRAPLGRIERASILALVLILAARQAHTQLRLLEQIAEQRRLQEQLRHAQKLEAVGRLAGGVAHDFNNLLTAIDGYSDLTLARLAPDHPSRGDILEVRRAAGRAAELTRQLLAFSRRQVLAPRVVDLNEVVRTTERMLTSLAGEQVELLPLLAPRPVLVEADPGQLELVLTNLVVNARDAMPSGGTITIETRTERGGGRPTARLVVADTGGGMTDETREHLFEPFFTTKDVGKGTGLGLAVVHGIVSQSGGEVSVSSRPGLGSRFELVFPAASAPSADPAPADAPEPEGTETVLLVEDEPAVRDLARRMLERAGYVVVAAASGEEAARLFPEAGADVLVTDLVMPGMGGRELASRLRDHCPDLAIVLMSGYSQDAEALDDLLAAGAAFLEKPFTSSALVSEVRSVLDAAVRAAA